MNGLKITLMVAGRCNTGWATHQVDGEDGICRACGFVNPPSVQWNHIDGPMMTLGNGQIKWLTWRERFMHWIGRWSLEDIARRPSRW